MLPVRLVDVSHTVRHGMVTYPGLPVPEIDAFLDHDGPQPYAPGVTFNIGRICMVANTGTYLDVPFHRWPDGEDLADVGIERLAGLPGVVVSPPLPDGRTVDADAFADVEVAGRAVLVRTAFDRHWGTDEYGRDNPFLTRGAAERLIERGAALVGIDSLNIDDIGDLERPVHSILLRAGIPIVEHLTRLDELPDDGFRFTAAPVKVGGMGTFPVRAYAEVPDGTGEPTGPSIRRA
jgi:kynurenine formamidase